MKDLIQSGEVRSIKIGVLRRITVNSLTEFVVLRDLEQNGIGD